MLTDFRFAFRQLLKSPGFSAIAVLTLALGIGANTAIFSVVNAVLLKPLPFPRAQQLVMLWQTNPEAKKLGFDLAPVSFPDFVDWRAQSRSFQGLSTFEDWTANLTSRGEAERIGGARVSANIFSLLGVQPILGRVFVPGEDQLGRNRVVILSSEFWQRRFGSNSKIIGQTLTLDSEPYTVVGVMPAGFHFPDDIGLPSYMTFGERSDIWTPLAPSAVRMKNRGGHNLAVIGRLNPGVDFRAAQAEMELLAQRHAQQYPETNKDWGISLVPLQKQAAGGSERALSVLMCAVGCILLIACANVANLLLARAVARQKEIAIRRALGAGRWRIIRQFLTESIVLAMCGGILGAMLALWGTDLLVALAPANLPRLGEVRLDAGVLGYTLLISLGTGLLFGFAPAFQSARVGLNESLKEGGRGSTGGRHRLRSGLVVSEIALALVLLIGAGLLIENFAQLLRVQPGFNPESVLTFNVVLPDNPYQDRAKAGVFFDQVVRRLQTLPGVKSVSASNALPLSGADEADGFEIVGRPRVPGQMQTANFRWVTPDYFRTMEIPLRRGRTFTERDNTDAPRVAVIDEAMARAYFPGADPIGQRLTGLTPNDKGEVEIVGMVGEVRHSSLALSPVPHLYVPHAQRAAQEMTIALRAMAIDPSTLVKSVRREVAAVDAGVPVAHVKTMRQMVSAALAPSRFVMALLSVFAALALVLAAIGTYGVLAYSVNQRQREIGIRMSLGAQRHDVLQLFLSHGMGVACIGIAIGLVGAFAVTRVMRSLLYSVSPTDPVVFAGVALGLALTALLASYLPARKATRVNPVVALRHE